MKTGALFWKLFGAIGISLMGSLVLGGILITVGVQRLPKDPPTRIKLMVAADLAAFILQRDGPAAAERFLEVWGAAGTIATLDGRCVVKPDTGPCARAEAASETREAVHDGERHEIVVSSIDRGKSHLLPPIGEPLLVGVPIGLLAALLLARHIVTPITSLGRSVGSVADGRFDTRVARSVANRRDEIGDLGRDIDTMAIRLARMTAGQKRLFHDISHELRSPLSRLRVASALARKVPDRLDEMLVRIDREIDRMDGLVDEILTLARLEAGADQSLHDDVDPARLLEIVLDDADLEARPRSIEIRRHIDHGSVCRCSAELLRRGFENIVRNALKFSSPGRTVDVVAARDVERGVLRVTVRDEGPGMSEEELVSAFEPFFRGNSSEPSQRGHGLGLSIAKRAIEDASGRIEVANNEGGAGVTIFVELPSTTRSR